MEVSRSRQSSPRMNSPRALPAAMKATTKATLGVILLVTLGCIHFRNNHKLSTFLPRRLASEPPTSPRISYSLLRNNTFQNLYSPDYRCNKHQLHPHMHDTLNFTTTISTNLKILFMGDSVAVQNAQSFQEAVGAVNRTILQHRQYPKTRGKHDSIFVSDAKGGGVVAGYRITDLLQRSRENKPLPNKSGGGWVRKDVQKLLNHTIRNETIGSFDVVVFRIPHGWIDLSNITEAKLSETVELANELFGVQHVIFMSLPFVNNIMTAQDLQELHETNTMIKEFAKKKHSAVNTIMVLDFGHLGNALIEWNGQLLGFNVNDNTDYLFERLSCCPKKGAKKGMRQAIAQVCSQFVEHGKKKCGPGNGFSIDGTHWCSESLNGRLNAGTACLIQCLYSDVTNVRACGQDCNDRYMSLRPVDALADEILPASVS